MNEKGIERLRSQGNDWQTQVRRTDRKERIKAERKQRQTESFVDLVTRNTGLNQRASKIVRLNEKFIDQYERLYRYGEDEGQYYAERNKRYAVFMVQFKSPWIVLQKGNPGKYDWVVGQVVQRGEWLDWSNHSFSSFATNEQSISRIKQNPLMNREELMRATSCITEHTFSPNGVMDAAKEKTTDRRVSPVSAVYRYLEHRKISGRLDRIQETAELFEQAIVDPALNPHLLHLKPDQPRQGNRPY